jgi:hypothetical protein
MDRPEVRSRGVRPGESDQEDERWSARLAGDAVSFAGLPGRIDVMTAAATFRDRVLDRLSGLGSFTS